MAVASLAPEPELRSAVTTEHDSSPLPPSPVEDRLRAYQATGNADLLWPDVPAALRTEAGRTTEQVTRTILSGGTQAQLMVSDERTARALGIAAFTSGLGPLLGLWIEQGTLEVSASVRQLMTLQRHHALRRNRRLREAMHGILDALTDARVPVTVLKGMHTVPQYFPDPAARTMTDVDVLVPSQMSARAAVALRAHGFEQVSRGRLPPRMEWAPAGEQPAVASLELTHADSPWTLDLHTTLDRRLFFRHVAGLGAPQAGDLQPFPGYHGVTALAQPMLTAFLAFHASIHFPRLQMIHLVELVFVIRTDEARRHLDWDALRRLLVGTHTAGLIFPALALTERLAPGTVDQDVLHLSERAATPRLRRRLRNLAPADAHGIGPYALRDKLLWSRTPYETALNLLDLVWPVHQEDARADVVAPYARRLRMLLGGRMKL